MARNIHQLYLDWIRFNKDYRGDSDRSVYEYLKTLNDDERTTWFGGFPNGVLSPNHNINQETYNNWTNYEALVNGQMSPEDFQAALGTNGKSGYSPEMEQYVNNMLADQRTQEARNWDEYVARNEYLWSGQQAQALGLSPSVISFGAAAGPQSAGTSNVSMHNLSQERKIATYKARMGLARQLISMTGAMASSGIYGSALGMAKRSSSVLASQAAHSGLQVLKNFNGKGNQTFALSPDGLFTGQ